MKKTTVLLLLFISILFPISSYAKSCSRYIGYSDPNLIADKNNAFQVSRSFSDYQNYCLDLEQNLKKLGRNGHWIDLGAGNVEAMRSYQSESEHLVPFAMTAIAYKKVYIRPGNIRYLMIFM